METNGWNEWSKHVLKELERLNENYEGLRNMNEEIKTELTKVNTISDDIEELKLWRARIDDVLSPTQLKELSINVQQLMTFKIAAITTWAVVQTITVIAMGILNLI